MNGSLQLPRASADPKLRQLRAFALTYRLGSFTQAAERMHLTQSATSQLVQQLEESLQVLLFDRTGRSLHPTQAADESIAEVERILGDVEHLKKKLQDLGARNRGRIRFACTPSFASMIMPAVIELFVAEHAQVRIDMRDAAPEKVLDLVLADDVDFGISTSPEETPGTSVTLIHEDWLSVVCSQASPIAEQDEVCWKDLSHQTVIGLDGGSGLPRVIREVLAAQGETYQPSYDFTYLHTAVAMAAKNLGVVLLPTYLAAAFPPEHRLTSRKLVNPVVPRNLCVLTRKGHALSALSETFIGSLRTVLH